MNKGYDDIRPYHDAEVPAVIRDLLSDRELLTAIGRYRFPTLSRWFAPVARKVIHGRLKQRFGVIGGVDQLQQVVRPWVRRILEQTSRGLRVEGLENLDANTTYLFMSNHRDIAMDPALINYALVEAGLRTSRIGIGDNLLNKEYVSQLMRLNKSFVVKRSVQGRREKLDAFNQLSAYIRESVQHGQHVWLAQREGRAKDGLDKTESAVLKMLHMSGKKHGWPLQQSLAQLNIVPVCISYEWDPCDKAKARELAALARDGEYHKTHDEDFRSIVRGIQGRKGRITIRFNEPLKVESDQAEDWCRVLDRRIYAGYELYPINYQACMSLYGELPDQAQSEQLSRADGHLASRLSVLNEDEQQQLLKAYAQPVLMKYQWNPNDV